MNWIAGQRARIQRPGLNADERRGRQARANVELPASPARPGRHAWGGLAVSRVTVRNQRTRWGSCGRNGHITLKWSKHPDVGKSAASKAVDNRAKRCLDELEQGSDQGARPLLLPGESRRRDSRMIAALYVESRGVYAGLPDVDLWDRDRDARTYRRTLASGRAPAMRQMGTVLLGRQPDPAAAARLGRRRGMLRRGPGRDATARRCLGAPRGQPCVDRPSDSSRHREPEGGRDGLVGGVGRVAWKKDTTGTAPARPQGGTQWAASCLAPAGEERSGQ